MTSLLMKPTSAGKDTLHKLDQPLNKLAYVSNHWGPLLNVVQKKQAKALASKYKNVFVNNVSTFAFYKSNT